MATQARHHIEGLTETEAEFIQHFEKPPEGSWTRSMGLDFEPVSMKDCYDPEFYELEKEAVFRRSWLFMGRRCHLPRKGSFFTRELDFLGYSVIIVRGMDDVVRAFHNVCSHRGNQLVWDEVPGQETRGNCRQFMCKYHGWRYGLDGEIDYVHNAPEYEGLSVEALKLPEIHCEVWADFVFVNFEETPRQSLREFLGPELVKLEEYPFDELTEWHRLEADVNANWKLFMDAFAEFYHVPYVHAKLNNPQGGGATGDQPPFMIPFFKAYGKHRMLSSGGQYANKRGRGVLPAQGIFKGSLYGPANPPDIGPRGELSNPGRLEGWGMDTWQLYPNFVVLTWSNNYVITYQYWPLGPDKHRFFMDYYFVPPKNATDRLTHEMIMAVAKDFALQDSNVLEATQRRIRSGITQGVPLFRPGGAPATSAPCGRRGRRGLPARARGRGAVDAERERSVGRPRSRRGMMADGSMLPEAFAELEPFAQKWCLRTERERYETRLSSTMEEMQALYDVGLPRGEDAQKYLDQFELYDLPEQELNLLHLMMSVIIVSFPVEAFRQPKVPDTGSTYLLKTVDPGP